MWFNDRPFEDGEVSSNGEDLSGIYKMSKDSNNEEDGGSGGGVRDKGGDNAKQLRRFCCKYIDTLSTLGPHSSPNTPNTMYS